MLPKLFVEFKKHTGMVCFLFGIFIVSVPQIFVFGELKPYSNDKSGQSILDIDKNQHFPYIINYFADILEAKKQPTPGHSIFFHETSWSTTGVVQLNSGYLILFDFRRIKC